VQSEPAGHVDEPFLRCAGSYRAESRLCSVAIPDAGSGAALLAERTEAGLAANSVRIIHATLRSMLAEAVRDELVERNVASIVRGPRIDHEEVRPWSLDEAATFLAAASTHRLSALFAVGVAVGLRRGELLALSWDDVDLDGGILRVRRTVQRLRGQGLVFWPPKSTRSRRSIRYLSPRARRCCLTVSARKWSG
jgi:integrase